MTKCNLLLVYPLFLIPALLAQSPFDGTWRINDDQSKTSPKPNVFSMHNGMYGCFSCSPKINIKADGTDQPVVGQYYESLNVREVDPKSIVLVGKKAGKIISEQTRTVSDDGNTMTVKNTIHEESGQVATSEITTTRVGMAPAGANATSGSWRMNALKLSENAGTVTFKSSGDELSMSDPVGASYTAKADGKDYPAKGSYTYNSVSLKRINERTIEETDKRAGEVVYVIKMTVSLDGKTMTEVSTAKRTGRTSTYIYDKR
jgi:hypothetical protein